MGIALDFAARIKTSPSPADELRHRLELELDLGPLARSLAVEESAHRAAQKNLPAPHARTPDADEQRIGQHFAALAARLGQQVGAAVATGIVRCDALREKFASSRLRACEDEAVEALDRHRTRSAAPLHEARRKEAESHRELDAFRGANRLTREPRPAPPWWLVAGGAAAAVVTEGLINAWAFAEGSPGGWRGGFIQAGVFSSITVISGIAAGLAARNFFHRRAAMKSLGVATTALYGAFLGVFALLGTHFRSALLEHADDAATQAVQRLVEAPLAIHDVNSLLLLICTVGFAGGSFATGLLAAGDIVPGYSRVHARWVARRQQLLEVRRNYLGGIDAVTEPMLGAVATRLREAREARAEFARVVAAGQQWMRDHAYFARRIDAACAEMIRRYRQANLEVRDAPAPEYFARDPAAVAAADAERFDTARLAENEALARSFPQHAGDLAELAAATQQCIRELRKRARSEADDFFAESEAHGARAPQQLELALAPQRAPQPAPRGNGIDSAAHDLPSAMH